MSIDSSICECGIQAMAGNRNVAAITIQVKESAEMVKQ